MTFSVNSQEPVRRSKPFHSKNYTDGQMDRHTRAYGQRDTDIWTDIKRKQTCLRNRPNQINTTTRKTFSSLRVINKLAKQRKYYTVGLKYEVMDKKTDSQIYEMDLHNKQKNRET